jgi:hypothetical protein
LNELSNRLNAIADSTDVDLDQLSEIVTYIKSNKSLIDNITTNKVSVADIIDNLTTSVSNKPLSAKQGVELKALVDEVASKLDANRTEWDYVVANSTSLNTVLKTLSGNVLVKGGAWDGSAPTLDIGTNIKHLRFAGTSFTTKMAVTFSGHCEKISGIDTEKAVSFGNIADEVADCKIGGGGFANQKVSDIYTSGVTQTMFDSCDYMNNIKGTKIAYMSCKHVNPFTCQMARSGVPMINENGSLSWLENAEGGSYGS